MNLYKHRGHINIVNPNSTIHYIGSDDRIRFSKNYITEPTNLHLKYYKQNPIEYTFNNVGFRTPDDFNSEDEGNIFLGCSHTFGTGHHLENTWSYKLNQLVGGKFWNLGLPGTGVMTHYRLLKGYYKELKVKNIFHFAPKSYARYEFIVNHKPYPFVVGHTQKETEDLLGNLLSESLVNDDEIDFMYNSYIDAIRWLAHEIGANYYLCDETHNEFITYPDNSLYARDLEHLSTLQQHSVYKYFVKKYDKSLLININDNLKVFDIQQLMHNIPTNIL